MHKIYTIGYATKNIDDFIAQLQRYQVTIVADIRSVPFSKVFHDYHQDALRAHLKQHDIQYVYLGEELGPRSQDESHYDEDGQVQFDLLEGSENFLRGIERLVEGINKSYAIALMCAEKDAINCHRSLLVGHFLKRNPLHFAADHSYLEVDHITHNGDIESQCALEKRLLALHNDSDDLFMSEDERRYQAFQTQLKLTSYRKELVK